MNKKINIKLISSTALVMITLGLPNQSFGFLSSDDESSNLVRQVPNNSNLVRLVPNKNKDALEAFPLTGTRGEVNVLLKVSMSLEAFKAPVKKGINIMPVPVRLSLIERENSKTLRSIDNSEEVRCSSISLKPSLPERPLEYSLRLISKREEVSQIQPGELGLFCENEKLYCKILAKEKVEIIKSDDPSIGLASENFDRILKTLEEKVDPVYFQAGLVQEKERNHTAASEFNNKAF